MMLKNMHIGIVGLGKMGLLHAGILNSLDGVKITAIAEKENLIANYVKNFMLDVSIYDDYNEMLESEKLDLVYITTPISSHLPVALSCIRNNVNFFIEKPLTKNLEESKTLCMELTKSPIIHSIG
ncbi:MAG: Gfo/Idh/MocA family protein, partial [Nitrososphaeraceae archaeon]